MRLSKNKAKAIAEGYFDLYLENYPKLNSLITKSESSKKTREKLLMYFIGVVIFHYETNPQIPVKVAILNDLNKFEKSFK